MQFGSTACVSKLRRARKCCYLRDCCSVMFLVLWDPWFKKGVFLHLGSTLPYSFFYYSKWKRFCCLLRKECIMSRMNDNRRRTSTNEFKEWVSELVLAAVAKGHKCLRNEQVPWANIPSPTADLQCWKRVNYNPFLWSLSVVSLLLIYSKFQSASSDSFIELLITRAGSFCNWRNCTGKISSKAWSMHLRKSMGKILTFKFCRRQ